ncbi:MAG: hypothetical protein WDN44_15975 [Sphingomonas sp.]
MRAYWRFPSAFLTLVEPFDQHTKTAIGFNHITLRGVYPEHLRNSVRTMIVTHGNNVRNAYPDMLGDIASLMRRKPATAMKLAAKWAAFDATPFLVGSGAADLSADGARLANRRLSGSYVGRILKSALDRLKRRPVPIQRKQR